MRRIVLACGMLWGVLCGGCSKEEPKAAPAPVAAVKPTPAAAIPTVPAPASTPAVKDEKTAEAILAGLALKIESIRDYHCKMRSYNRLDAREDVKTLELWFRKPLEARSLVLEGENQGGLAVRNSEGVLRARKGGVLSVLTLTLKDTDERLRGIRGKRFFDASWEAILKEFSARKEKGWKLEKLEDQIVNNVPCWVITLHGEATGTEPAQRVTKDMICVNQHTMELAQRAEFEGDIKASESTFMDVEVNPGLADDLFHL